VVIEESDMLTNSDVDTASSFHKDDDEFLQWALEGMAECESKWHAAHVIYSWIDPYPVWVSSGDWSEYLGDGFLPDPLKPCRRVIRFSLIGGGQIRVTEQWTDRPLFDGDKGVWCEADSKLLVSAHTDQGLRRYPGHLDHGWQAEMATRAVVFGPNTPQDIADRTAATLRAIDRNSDNFRALLDGSSGCAFCSRALKDEVSKLIGVGPDCAKQNGIPHTTTAASKRLELRRKLLGETH
jgi:Family of unknown function (DUF6011)